MSGHYFYQDLVVARRLFEARPRKHVDVGSRIDGFVAHLAVFREVEVFDVRTISHPVPNVVFTQADLMGPLDESLANYCDSLSCLHALEHFGLGRYGDPITYDGHLRGLGNLLHILQSGGKLYLSVPIGPQRIEFNAHRVFSVAYLITLFAERCTIDRFSYVNDRGQLFEDVALSEDSVQSNCGCVYGCGIFELTKCR
ncbi:MAG: hypothetical protein A3H27_13470 [Acidobacteria bacterium RIFCSPLOWO2_02_FULL_59_13]|nr:MAG: hypothetical protein A3H27_13470 [Acidobacteria bacterium RIFCSPLOWO2_02_FULL_59_13]